MSEEEAKKDIPSCEETPESQDSAEESHTAPILPEPGKVRVKRRDFMGKVLVGCGAVLGGEIGYSGIKLMATKPAAEKTPVQISLSQLPEGSRTTVLYGGNKIEVVRTEKGIRAMSMVCTHLGCLVIWEEGKKTYHCPCHDAYFADNGDVISGPPTQPLEEIPVSISGNTVTIGG